MNLLDSFATNITKLMYTRYAADLIDLIQEYNTCHKQKNTLRNQSHNKTNQSILT